jgi:hypothetical protein
MNLFPRNPNAEFDIDLSPIKKVSRSWLLKLGPEARA